MDGIICDRCGRGLLVDEEVRYEVRIVVQAAADPMELTHEDLQRDRRAEIQELLERLQHTSPAEAQDQVHREFRFDLCLRCQAAYIVDPLGGSSAT